MRREANHRSRESDNVHLRGRDGFCLLSITVADLPKLMGGLSPTEIKRNSHGIRFGSSIVRLPSGVNGTARRCFAADECWHGIRFGSSIARLPSGVNGTARRCFAADEC
jgi:hypothetical protein